MKAECGYQVCSRCIYDSKISNIVFGADGVCNYCKQIDELSEFYGTGGLKGKADFKKIIAQIKSDGKGKKYDCVIGVSGGTDSSYLIMKAVDWGLRPLAVHYDNTWNASTATMNIARVTKTFGVDLWTHVLNNEVADDIKKAFLLAGVREFDADTDIALAQVMRAAAAKFGIKYILEGHSFYTEGISPIGTNYLDGGYVEDVHKKFGNLKPGNFPNMKFWMFMKWLIIYRQKFIRPFWYIDYNKERAREELIKRTGWEYYGGHHLENMASAFAHKVWLPQRFGSDLRNLTLAASARNGSITREHALEEYKTPIALDHELVEYVKKRLMLTDREYFSIMNSPVSTWKEYNNYKKRFERLRFIFKILADANMVPRSFYLKYCFPIEG